MSETPSCSPSPPTTPPPPAGTPVTTSSCPGPDPAPSPPPDSLTTSTPFAIQSLPLDRVHPGPADERRAELDQDELSALADSIARLGVLQPIIVAASPDGWVTLAGRRRREAARLANLTHIPAIITTFDAQKGWSISFAENYDRANLTPLEEAAAIAAAIQDHGMTEHQVAHAMHRSVGWVRSRLDVLTWPDDVQDAVHSGSLSLAAAAPLASVPDDPTRKNLIWDAINYGAVARTTSAWAQAAKAALASGRVCVIDPTAGPERPPPSVPYAECWACRGTHPVSALSYMPTCPNCATEIPQAMFASQPHASTPTPIPPA